MSTDLWNRVVAHDLDQPKAPYGFSTRVADENFWTRNFTQKAILEYKKFMFLAATSESMVSPSPVIDRVWHEHLMFSKSYEDFCNLLGKQIQHVPSQQNPAEYEKFRSAKERTLNLYQKAFGEPPADIWKFDSMYESLNLPKARINIRTFVNIGIVATAGLLAPVAYLLRPLYVNIDNPYFVRSFVVVAILSLLALKWWNRRRLRDILSRAHPASFVFDLHPLEVVFLENQKLKVAINGPLNKMVVDGKVDIDNKRDLKLVEGSHPSNHDEAEIMRVFEIFGRSNSYPRLMSQLESSPVFMQIMKSMDALKKYIWKSKAFGAVFYVNFCVVMVAFMAGFIRLSIGVERDRPITAIAGVLILFVLASATHLYALSTAMSKLIIPAFYKKVIIPKRKDQQEWSWQYVLLGSTVLSPAFQRMDTSGERSSGDGSSASSTCGSGGGSSCGSSCGGCGGGGD